MSHNPKDNQALLQSMLQRLKLQPGREGQSFPDTPAPVTVASTWAQGGERGEPNHQNVNHSSANGFQFAADKGRGVQQPGHCEVDGGLTSFPSHKGNTNEGTGEKRVVGSAQTSTGREQLVPVRSVKGVDTSSFASSVMGHTPGEGGDMKGTRSGQEQNPFTPKVYKWSLKSTDGNPDVGGGVSKVGDGVSEESRNVQLTNSSSLRRNQRTSENRTRRWTQKIKERWRDKHGSFSKKGKEGGGIMAQKSEQASPQNKPLTDGNMLTPPLKEEEMTLRSLDNSDPSKTPPAHTDDGRARSNSDFEFGLGSFSLLDEITMGQEWAKFLNPNLSAASVYRGPSEEPLGQFTASPNSSSSVQPSATLSQEGGQSNQWSFWRTKAAPGSHLGLAQVSCDGPLPVSMDVTEGKQQQAVLGRADLSEPMDDGRMQPAERCSGRQHRPPSFVQPAGIVDHSRVHPNRKRQHRPAEKTVTEAHREGSASTSSCQEMAEAEGTHRFSLGTPQSPTSPSLFAPVPRGVLKHSMSQDSEASMETMSKRRRVEENRRVRFSEDVVAIEPQDVAYVDAFESSEEESGGEEDSVTEQECEVEQAPAGEEAPARRHNLPAWILALKKRNAGRKNR